MKPGEVRATTVVVLLWLGVGLLSALDAVLLVFGSGFFATIELRSMGGVLKLAALLLLALTAALPAVWWEAMRTPPGEPAWRVELRSALGPAALGLVGLLVVWSGAWIGPSLIFVLLMVAAFAVVLGAFSWARRVALVRDKSVYRIVAELAEASAQDEDALAADRQHRLERLSLDRPEWALTELLYGLFGSAELRAFVGTLSDEGWVAELSPAESSLGALARAAQVVDLLRRRGAIDGALFDALAASVTPERGLYVTRVREAWLRTAGGGEA